MNVLNTINPNLIPLSKFLLITFPIDFVMDKIFYSVIGYANTAIAHMLHSISPFHSEYKVCDYENNSYNFAELVSDHIKELPAGLMVHKISDDLVKLPEKLDYLSEKLHLKIGILGTKFIEDTLISKLFDIYEVSHTGSHIKEAFIPYYEILVENESPECSIKEINYDLKIHTLFAYEYYKKIIDYSGLGHLYNELIKDTVIHDVVGNIVSYAESLYNETINNDYLQASPENDHVDKYIQDICVSDEYC